MLVVGAVVVLASFVVFLWSAVGIIRPTWARLPSRLHAVGVWIASVALLVIGVSVVPDEAPAERTATTPEYGRPEGAPEWLQPLTPDEQAEVDAAAERRQAAAVAASERRQPRQNPNVVNVATWSDGPWPLTVESGLIVCYEGAPFIGTQDDLWWPLTGQAQAIAGRYAAEPSVDPIWRSDPNIPGARVNIGPLIRHALALC